MRIFVGIVPPPEISSHILESAKELVELSKGELHVPRSEPHITLKAPQIVESADKIIRLVGQIAQSTSPILIEAADPSMVRNKYVVLMIHSTELQRLHESLTTALAPFNSQEIERNEGREYRAHISVAKADLPVGNSEPYLKEARRMFSDEVKFQAEHVVVFSLDEASNSYSHLAEIPLLG